MTKSPNPLDILAEAAPNAPKIEVLDLLIREYGLRGKLSPLVSERDQNFRLDATDGRQFVVKIAHSAEPAQITDFQIQALISGFDSIVPLEDRECELLFDLIRMRLATTITILYWRKSARSEEDAYLKKALREQSSERFLRHINRISRQGFADRVLTSINAL